MLANQERRQFQEIQQSTGLDHDVIQANGNVAAIIQIWMIQPRSCHVQEQPDFNMYHESIYSASLQFICTCALWLRLMHLRTTLFIRMYTLILDQGPKSSMKRQTFCRIHHLPSISIKMNRVTRRKSRSTFLCALKVKVNEFKFEHTAIDDESHFCKFEVVKPTLCFALSLHHCLIKNVAMTDLASHVCG